MWLKTLGTSLFCLLVVAAGHASASLIPIGTATYDDGSGAQEYNIIYNSSPNLYPGSPTQPVVFLDYNFGSGNFADATAWAESLNSAIVTYTLLPNYSMIWGGSSWRLPTTTPGEFSGDYDPNSTLYQIPGSEFSSLYIQLGGTNNSGLPTVGPFNNLDPENWYTVNGDGAPYAFDTAAGWQYTGDGFIAMAVRSGILVEEGTAVPEPSTFLLVGAGLGGLALIRRKSRK